MDFNIEVDARQLACPLPILRAKKALSQMVSGEILKLIATDRGAPLDFMVFCENTGNVLLSSVEQDGEFVFLIKRR
ncbi:MAG: sulfurtransferase TusA family protein [Gallionella sp.]|nr:sulfurtransferase TusA family protein [Gallionella sp.]